MYNTTGNHPILKIRIALFVAGFMLLASSVLTGCGTSGQPMLADMMNVLPAETDSLFLIRSDMPETIPDFSDTWHTLTEQTLPPGTSPASLGIASRHGNLTGLCYTFDGETPSFPAASGEQVEIGGFTVTRTDNFWDSFTLGTVLVVSVKDYTEEIITGHQESAVTMSAAFQDIPGHLPDGIFQAAVKDLDIGGKKANLLISLAKDKDSGYAAVTGFFSTADGTTELIESYLARCSVTNISLTDENGWTKVSGLLDPADFSSLMDGLTPKN